MKNVEVFNFKFVISKNIIKLKLKSTFSDTTYLKWKIYK